MPSDLVKKKQKQKRNLNKHDEINHVTAAEQNIQTQNKKQDTDHLNRRKENEAQKHESERKRKR